MRFQDIHGNKLSAVKIGGPLTFNGSNGEQTIEAGMWFCEPDPIDGKALWPFALTDEQMQDFTQIED